MARLPSRRLRVPWCGYDVCARAAGVEVVVHVHTRWQRRGTVRRKSLFVEVECRSCTLLCLLSFADMGSPQAWRPPPVPGEHALFPAQLPHASNGLLGLVPRWTGKSLCSVAIDHHVCVVEGSRNQGRRWRVRHDVWLPSEMGQTAAATAVVDG